MTAVVFGHGTVFDGSRFLPPGSAVAVVDGRIRAVGDLVTCRQAAGPTAETVDLAGGTLVPGFIDSHLHPVFAGNQLRQCDLRPARTPEGYCRLVADYAAGHPSSEWIVGGGWDLAPFGAQGPSRTLLDAVVPDRPVYLARGDGHGAWVNSAALARVPIDSRTADPPDGRIERDPDGNPTGVLQDGAASLVGRLLPKVDADDWYRSLLLAQDHLIALGITGWQDAIVGDYLDGADPLPAYLRAAGDGNLLASVVGALWWDRDRGIGQIDDLIERRRRGQAPRFRAGACKIMLDGIAETHTAALLDPYCGTDDSTDAGLEFLGAADLARAVTALDGTGFDIHVHTIGDRAVRHALDALETASRPSGLHGRHQLAHVQMVDPHDVPRFAALGVTANIQPFWAKHELLMDDLTVPFVGPERAGRQYPFGDLARAGVRLVGGSDWPVTTPSPLAAIHVAVNRSDSTSGGRPAEPAFLPRQALSRESALCAYTSAAAWINRWEGRAGTVRAGYDADLAVVDADLAVIDDAEIGAASVTQTWIGGVCRYQAG